MQLTSFGLEMAIPILFGLTASAYLQKATRQLLTDVCGSQERSDFWIHVLCVALVGTPTILSLAFSQSTNADASLGELARRSLLMSIIGILFAVLYMARAIMKSIERTNTLENALQTVIAPYSTGAAQTKAMAGTTPQTTNGASQL